MGQKCGVRRCGKIKHKSLPMPPSPSSKPSPSASPPAYPSSPQLPLTCSSFRLCPLPAPPSFLSPAPASTSAPSFFSPAPASASAPPASSSPLHGARQWRRCRGPPPSASQPADNKGCDLDLHIRSVQPPPSVVAASSFRVAGCNKVRGAIHVDLHIVLSSGGFPRTPKRGEGPLKAVGMIIITQELKRITAPASCITYPPAHQECLVPLLPHLPTPSDPATHPNTHPPLSTPSPLPTRAASCSFCAAAAFACATATPDTGLAAAADGGEAAGLAAAGAGDLLGTATLGEGGLAAAAAEGAPGR